MIYPDDFIDKVICGDCLEVMKEIPDNSVDLVLTDPPYPDQHLEYGQVDLLFLEKLKCRQLIFWSPKCDFPLNYTAIHIWDCKNDICPYERIFERNGHRKYRAFHYLHIFNKTDACFARDIFTGHPSQKPIQLLTKLISEYSNKDDIILDPFLGSGTTAVACKQLNRHFIGIEINPDYCKIAGERLMGVPDSLFKDMK